MDKSRAGQLFEKLRNDTLNDQERAELESWYNLHAAAEQPLKNDEIFRQRLAEMDEAFPFEYQTPTRRFWPRIAAAASILLCLSIGLYFYNRKTKPETTQIAKNDIAPGSNRATLTLANGQKIVLDTASNGKLASQGNTIIQKSIGGSVTYTTITAAKQSDNIMQYNTLTTKRGEQYPLVLADGTKVWLNSASSITYPVAFNGSERKVTITGEAYFEVVHNDNIPFRVTAGGQTVEDIGTHFNINAYDDEPAMKTTLLEGSVKITKDGQLVILKPGQAAALRDNQFKVTDADAESAVAWKNGLFRFDNTNVQSLMRQLARWYDIEVEYQGTVTSYEFAGEIRRNTNLSNVLKILEQGGIHFRVEGRKLIVTP